MSNELKVTQDEGGRHSEVLATIVPREKILIAIMATILGFGGGTGGGYAGVQIAQAKQEADIASQAEKIEVIQSQVKELQAADRELAEKLSEIASAAIKDSEGRLNEKLSLMQTYLDKQESTNQAILRAIGRLEGKLEGMDKK